LQAIAFYTIPFANGVVKSPDHIGLQLANPGGGVREGLASNSSVSLADQRMHAPGHAAILAALAAMQITPLSARPARTAASQANYTLKRSKGFEGMAASPDKKFLYPLMEGALYDVAGKFYENVTHPVTGNRTDVLRIWKFNVETKTFEVGCALDMRARWTGHPVFAIA
jgi:hypothetical protein